MINLKRIYEKSAKTDGYRILVDRLWPRGVSKAKARLDFWCKDIGPSNELRQWFGHEPKKWPAFQKKYLAELKKNKEAVGVIKKAIKANSEATLLFAARDEIHNEAVVIKKFLGR